MTLEPATSHPLIRNVFMVLTNTGAAPVIPRRIEVPQVAEIERAHKVQLREFKECRSAVKYATQQKTKAFEAK